MEEFDKYVTSLERQAFWVETIGCVASVVLVVAILWVMW